MASYDEKHQAMTIPYFEEEYSAEHTFKIYVGIGHVLWKQTSKYQNTEIYTDFGTDGSGLAYALQDGQTYIHNLWRDVSSVEKPKTSVLFDDNKEVQCHGNQAVIQYISSMNNDGWALFERFKMQLYRDPTWKRDIKPIDQNANKIEIKEEIQSTNDNSITETSENVFVAQLKFLKNEAMTFIMRNFKRKKKLKFNQDDIQWILTVPAMFSLFVHTQSMLCVLVHVIKLE